MTCVYYVVFDEKYGRSVPDARVVGDVADRLQQWNNGDKSRYVSDVIGNALLLKAYQMAIINGDIDPAEIQFVYEEDVLYHENGNIYQSNAVRHWPEGMCAASREIVLNFTKAILR